MLKLGTVSATALLAQRLTDAGVALTPIAPSPLASIVNKCWSPVIDSNVFMENTTPCDVVYRMADSSTACNADESSPHCEIMGEIVNLTKDAVASDLHIARNVVNPIILQVVEDVQTFLRQRENAYGNVLAVVPDTFDTILQSPIFRDIIGAYETVSAYADTVVPSVHPALSKEQVLGFMQTGSSRFDDKDLAAWVEEVSIDFVFGVYNEYLRAPNSDSPHGNLTIANLFGTDPLSRRKLIVLHLLARRFSKDPLDGIEMDAVEYERAIGALLSQTGRLLCRVIEDRERKSKSKDVIRSWPSIKDAEWNSANPELSQITVNMDVYTRWLDAGGCPEILFGACVSDREEGYDALLENGERYKRTWENRAALIQNTVRHNSYNNTIVAIRASVARAIVGMDMAYVPENSLAPLHARLETVLRNVNIDDTANLVKCLRDVITAVMFPHTNARLVLTTIDRVALDNPTLDIREAALIAVIKITANWYAKQIARKSISSNQGAV